MVTELSQFIDQPIEVTYAEAPILEKVPACPDGFTWNGREYQIKQVEAEWLDLKRRGRDARNMSPPHAARAAMRGSWGVGRFYFRVWVDTGQLFDIYFDRAPGNIDDRKGGWFLLGERKKQD
jgi:hypothetical protein